MFEFCTYRVFNCLDIYNIQSDWQHAGELTAPSLSWTRCVALSPKQSPHHIYFPVETSASGLTDVINHIHNSSWRLFTRVFNSISHPIA